jgi:hypothetical protein
MSNPALHNKITYIELSTTNTEHTKKFYGSVFGWSFQDWGPDYIGFSAAETGIDGGFSKVEAHEVQAKSAPLVILERSESHGGRGDCCRRRNRYSHFRVPRRPPFPLLRRRRQHPRRLVRVGHCPLVATTTLVVPLLLTLRVRSTDLRSEICRKGGTARVVSTQHT